MRFDLGLLVFASSSAAVAAEAGKRTVSFEVKKNVGPQTTRISRSHSKRTAYLENLFNNITGGGYNAQVSVGTPGQPMSLVLDTGSSDAWVVSYDADLCTSKRVQQEEQDTCSETYNPNNSSTYKLVKKSGFSITYLDGTAASGDYISDTFSIGGATVQSLQIGYATEAPRGTGILGVGFDTNEAARTEYPNLLDQMISQNIISREAYSLWLNDLDTSTGSILFGGVDTAKFIGTLGLLPILKSASSSSPTSSGSYVDFAVALTGIQTIISPGNSSTVSNLSTRNELPAILDSGTTLSYVPGEIANDIFEQVGAYTDNSIGYTWVPCNIASTYPSLAINFTFGSTSQYSISVPAAELVIDQGLGNVNDTDSQLPSDIPFNNPCIFGIQNMDGSSSSSGSGDKRATAPSQLSSGTSEYALLGDTFLRSAYVLYDLAGKQIGLAQSNLNASDSSVTELPSGSATSLPTLVGVAAQQTTATGAAVPTGGSSTSSSGGSSTTSGSSAAGTGTSSGGSTTVTVTQSKSSVAVGVRPPPVGEWFAVMAVSAVFAAMGGVIFVL